MLKVGRRTSSSTGANRNGLVLTGRAPRPSKLVDDLQINLIGRKHVGREIYSQLLESIEQGRLEPGRRLPPTRELARRLKVGRTTVSLAYDRLADEGLLISRVGAGTFVKERRALPASDAKPRESPLRPKQEWVDVPITFIRTLFANQFEFDFRTGKPDVSAFPHARWRGLMARHLDPSKVTGGYGDPAGHPALRTAIARHIWLTRGMNVDPETVTITNGTQQALDLITKILIERGDRVAVENPGYPPAWRLFRSVGARVLPIPLDDEGFTVSALPSDTRLVYVTPSHQFPVGVAMSRERRSALIEWAQQANAVIVEDDYDGEFRFGDRPIEPLRAMDPNGRVIYVGSFSKSALPSLRIGFLITPASLTAAIHAAKYLSDWHTMWAVQGALADFIEEGWYARHVRRMRKEYETRHIAVVKGIDTHFRNLMNVAPSAVGLHICAMAAQLSPGDVHSAVTRAVDVGVDELSRYSAGQPVSGLLFGYGAIHAERIDEGLRRLRHWFDA
jgi:GntR family transcriptional regulator/MocR family aminotransferase